MNPRPQDEMREYAGRSLLSGVRALITGGDSGIGRAVAVAFASGQAADSQHGSDRDRGGGGTPPAAASAGASRVR